MGAVFVLSEARGGFLREASDLDSPVFCWVNIGIGIASKQRELAFELNISFEMCHSSAENVNKTYYNLNLTFFKLIRCFWIMVVLIDHPDSDRRQGSR